MDSCPQGMFTARVQTGYAHCLQDVDSELRDADKFRMVQRRCGSRVPVLLVFENVCVIAPKSSWAS